MKKWIRHAVLALLDSNLSVSGLLTVIIKKPVLILLNEYCPEEK